MSSGAAAKNPDQIAAEKKLDELISNRGAPKGLGQGLGMGVGNIVAGAVGGAGVAVLAPTMGLAAGVRSGGVVGGVVGLFGGALVGIVGGTVLAVGGALQGVGNIVGGVLAAPQAAIAPRQGKWWNENEGHWVLTNMAEEAKVVNGVPDDDYDILGLVDDELEQAASIRDDKISASVKDMYYYDKLEVPASADQGTIRRKYYLMAKKYHPDRHPGDKEAADTFKEVAEAYQVLSDPELRKKYDKEGKEGLSPDKTEVAGMMQKIDPAILFAFLFGSDKFNDYVGRLSTATSASVGDSPKISKKDGMLIQKRRLVRLTLKLIEKTKAHVDAQAEGISTSEIEEAWRKEALELSSASYGYEMVMTIGKLYDMMGTMYQGSIDSQQGIPSLSKWAERQKARSEKKNLASKNAVDGLKNSLDLMQKQNELACKLKEAKTEEEKEAIKKETDKYAIGIMLRVMWTTSVVDISSTLYEVTHMMFFDQSVDKETRMRRSEAVKVLGECWTECPKPEGGKDTDVLYEEAAFAAMLETVKRKEA